MGIYEGFKDAINIAQKADNIDLYRKLLDLSRDALDLQEENARLKQELALLKSKKDLSDRIVYHKNKQIDDYSIEHPYITLSSDKSGIRYCAICWGRDHKLIPLYDDTICKECRRLSKK